MASLATAVMKRIIQLQSLLHGIDCGISKLAETLMHSIGYDFVDFAS
jgi:hypothetical protein